MGWFLFFLAVIATITGFIIGMLLAYLFDESSSKSMSIKDITVFVITTMLIMYTAANAAVYNMTPSSKDRIATFAEAASLYGFSSGSEYPLEIGGRSVSANGEAAIGGGFAISAYIRMQAGASILVDYQYPDGSHEALEIPLSKIKFNIIGDDETSSMVINLIDLPYAKGYVSKDILGDCYHNIRWGWWMRECPTVENTQVTSTIGDEGLSGLIQKALASNPGKFVTMNVTEAEYQQILGSTNTQTEAPTPSPTQR